MNLWNVVAVVEDELLCVCVCEERVRRKMRKKNQILRRNNNKSGMKQNQLVSLATVTPLLGLSKNGSQFIYFIFNFDRRSAFAVLLVKKNQFDSILCSFLSLSCSFGNQPCDLAKSVNPVCVINFSLIFYLNPQLYYILCF